MNFADYKIEEDGLVLCEPCLCFTFFSDAEVSATAAPDLLGPYRTFLEDFKDSITYCRTDGDQMHATRITPEDLEALPKWLADPRRRARDDFTAEFRTGKNRKEWRPPCIEFSHSSIGKSHTFFRIALPLDWLARNGTEGVERYLTRSLAGFPLQSGYVGYSITWERSSPQVHDATAPYFLR